MSGEIRLPASEGDALVGHYVVAYIDLLGQREVLSNLRGRPLDEDDENHFKELAIECVRKVYTFRSHFHEFFQAFTGQSTNNMPLGIAPEEIEHINKLAQCDIRFQGFSDTLIIYLPLKNAHGIWQTKAINGLLFALALLLPEMLAKDMPFRAGVEAGVGAELVPGEIYGPVLQDAYELEDKKARYPRIIVGNGLVEFIDDLPQLTQGNLHDNLLETMSVELKSLLFKVNSTFEVDYAGKKIRNLKVQRWARGIRRAHKKAKENAAKFEGMGNLHVAEKYRQVVQYLDGRCSDFLM